MPECEVCGRVIDRARKVSIDGIILETCNNCSRMGKIVRKRKKKTFVKKRTPLPEIKEVKPKELVADFAKILRERREQMKLMQKNVALKLNLPLSLIKRTETGFRPEDSVIKKLERFYNINLFEEEE